MPACEAASTAYPRYRVSNDRGKRHDRTHTTLPHLPPRAIRCKANRRATHRTSGPSHLREACRSTVDACRPKRLERSVLAQDRTAALARLTFGPIVLAMLAMALLSKFAAWQIEQSRFGGFAAYMTMFCLSRRNPPQS